MFRRAFLSDMRRALRSWGFWLAVALIAATFWAGVFQYAGDFADSGRDWAMWFLEGAAGLSAFLPLTTALFCGLPAATALAADMDSRYYRQPLARMGLRAYSGAKVVACALAAALAEVAALGACMLACAIAFGGSVRAPDMRPSSFSRVYEASRWGYCLMLTGMHAFFAASYSCVALAAACWSRKVYIALAAPFVLAFFLSTCVGLVRLPVLSSFYWLSPEIMRTEEMWVPLLGVGAVAPIGWLAFRKGLERRAAQ